MRGDFLIISPLALSTSPPPLFFVVAHKGDEKTVFQTLLELRVKNYSCGGTNVAHERRQSKFHVVVSFPLPSLPPFFFSLIFAASFNLLSWRFPSDRNRSADAYLSRDALQWRCSLGVGCLRAVCVLESPLCFAPKVMFEWGPPLL